MPNKPTYSPIALAIWEVARSSYNGAPDPGQEIYDRGYVPALEHVAEILDAYEGTPAAQRLRDEYQRQVMLAVSPPQIYPLPPEPTEPTSKVSTGTGRVTAFCPGCGEEIFVPIMLTRLSMHAGVLTADVDAGAISHRCANLAR